MPSGAFRALRPIILASSSPRRRELLGSLGIDFTIKVVDGSEPAPTLEDDPAAYAMRAAQAKAEAVARAAGPETPDAVVLGSDTIVVLHEEHGPIILGKPASRDEALAMLLHLSGRTHTVYTGCCIIWLSAHGESRTELFYDAADVTFAEWPEDVLLRHTGPRLLPCLGNQRPMGDNRGPPRTCRGEAAYGRGRDRLLLWHRNKSFIKIKDSLSQVGIECRPKAGYIQPHTGNNLFSFVDLRILQIRTIYIFNQVNLTTIFGVNDHLFNPA